MLSAFTAREEQYRIVKTAVDGLLAVVGFGLAGYVSFQLVRQWDQLDKEAYPVEFAVPVWMTIGALPFIYFIMLYADINRHSGLSRRCRTRPPAAGPSWL
jgi:type VI protein secretion system component VasF